MINKYQEATKKLENMSYDEVKRYLQRYSSKLKDMDTHCRDLVDLGTGYPYITSILGSALTVVNNEKHQPKMSEEIYEKASAIKGYTQNRRNHNFSKDEILFILGYITLYHKRNAIDCK